MTAVKRRMAMLVAVSAVSGVMTLFAPTSTTPAQALTPHGECVGLGTAQLSSGFYYPVGPDGTPSSAHSANFTFSFDTGVCNPPGTVHAAGTAHGWCGLSVGSGTANTTPASNFHWIGVGGTLVVTGQISGAVNAVPDTLAGESCLRHNGARSFRVNGAAVHHSCDVVNIPSQSVTSASVHALGASAHINVTGNHIFGSAHVDGISTSVSVPVGQGHLTIHPTYSVCI